MKNQSVYQALMRSPQWKAWYEHAENNHLFDVAETAECDWMSDKHFQAFIEFCKTFNNPSKIIRNTLSSSTKEIREARKEVRKKYPALFS